MSAVRVNTKIKLTKKMDYNQEIIRTLKQIIKEKERQISIHETMIKTMSVQLELASDLPKKNIETAIMFLNIEIPQARQRSKKVLQDLKKMLEYESTERTVASKN